MSKPVMKHRQGSRKERVHQAFAQHGADKAFALGRKLRLKGPTLRTWFSAFRRTRLAIVKKGAATPSHAAAQ